MRLTDDIRVEIEKVQRATADGVLREEDVLARARHPGSALHQHFMWDDTIAAEEWRLEQARRLIAQIKVQVTTRAGEVRTVRAYVSLATDRVAGGGYRPLVDVLGSAAWHEEMLRTALAELEALRKRFETLQELEPIFRAIEKVVARKRPKGRPEKEVTT